MTASEGDFHSSIKKGSLQHEKAYSFSEKKEKLKPEVVKKYLPYPSQETNYPIHAHGIRDLQQGILLVFDVFISTVTDTSQYHNECLSSGFLSSIIIIITITVRLGLVLPKATNHQKLSFQGSP